MTEANLLIETSHMMQIHNKTVKDISWIGGRDFYIDIEDFFLAAKETNYDCGYGDIEVASDLVIVFKDGSWLSRGEYDGSEFWRYNHCPQKPKTKFIGTNLKLADSDGYNADAWNGLKKLNE